MVAQVVSTSFISPAWMKANGPANDVALSTRARLARNIEGIPFPSRAQNHELRRVADLVLDAVYSSRDLARYIGRTRVIRPTYLPQQSDRLALVDARVASSLHISAGHYRPIVVDESGTISIMVNEEDHLRIQCILPGLHPAKALQMVQEVDSLLQLKLQFARADNYGYLTSSLANVGTGLRVSVMIHLAALAYLEQVVPVLTAATELKTSVRGLFGEGTHALGDVYQVSNETTTGFSEKEIMCRVRGAADYLISREREARRQLLNQFKIDFQEANSHAWKRLMEARSLGGREAMACLSLLRLAYVLGITPHVSPKAFNELLGSMRLGASASTKRSAENVAEDVRRARYVRERLTKEPQPVQLAFLEAIEPES